MFTMPFGQESFDTLLNRSPDINSLAGHSQLMYPENLVRFFTGNQLEMEVMYGPEKNIQSEAFTWINLVCPCLYNDKIL